MMKTVLLGWGLLACWWTGCGPEADPDVVARVGEREITRDQLRQFRGDATANYRDPEEGLEAWRFYLQTMIDMELMLAEARAAGLGRELAFERKWLDERRKKLVDEYSARTIIKEVDLAVDDMRASFAGSKWNKVLQLAHIRTESEADAQKAMRDLEQGRDFAAVARARSVVPVTAQRGGVLNTWFGRGNLEEMGLTVEIGEALFELAIGDFSQPFVVGDYYEIFKVLAEGPAPDHYRASFLREQYWQEFRTQWASLVDRLREQMNVQLQGQSIKILVERMTGVGREGMLLGPEDRNVILATFDGGQVTIENFAETYNAYWFIRSVSFDSSGIAEFIHSDLLPRTLVYHKALEEGLDSDSTIVAWLDGKKESMLLEALREREVVQCRGACLLRRQPESLYAIRGDRSDRGAGGDPCRSRPAARAGPRRRRSARIGRPPHHPRRCRGGPLPHAQPPVRTARFRRVLRHSRGGAGRGFKRSSRARRRLFGV